MTARAAGRRRAQVLDGGWPAGGFGSGFWTGRVWVEFLRRAPGYIATKVECESPGERRYRVRDFWSWHRYFELFRERFAVDCERFERLIEAEGLVDRQQFVGAYYEKAAGDGDELVPG